MNSAAPASTRVAMIGVGRMGEAVLAGLIAAGWDPSDLVAAEPNATQAEHVRRDHGVAVVTPAQAAAGADVIVIAVKPQDVVDALRGISASVPGGSVVVSLAAGVPLSVLEQNLPAGAAVVRVMPNTPALVGQGMSVMSPGSACTPQQVALTARVLGAVGRVAQVPEASQDAVTAVSGSGPAYVFYVAEAMIDAGVMMGLARPLAAELACQTLLGAATMLAGSGERPAELRERVTSPGGTTAVALHTLDNHAVKAGIANAMLACRDRSAEMTRAATS